MNISVDDLFNYLIEKYSFDMLVLDEAGMGAEHGRQNLVAAGHPSQCPRCFRSRRIGALGGLIGVGGAEFRLPPLLALILVLSALKVWRHR